MTSGVYNSLKCELDKGEKAVVATLIDERGSNREVSDKITLTEEQVKTSNIIDRLGAAAADKARSALETGILQYIRASKGTSILIEPYFPQPRLIVLGGGDIARPLVEFGAKAGFLVTVIDDRPMFACRDRFPDADKIICESFSSSLSQLALNEYSFVVIVTREHRQDVDCLRAVLNCKTAYTGMIGSRQSVSGIKNQLISEGYSADRIDMVNAPIGLDIGADTPEEIAISIMAQVIGCRRHAGTATDKTALDKLYWPVLERPVLEELCKDTKDPRALITVLETKGSVPRKAGTKMLVWAFGMTVGSIGGGYAEGEVINTAWKVIGSGGTEIHDIDLTGQIAEEEGMVCGGIMRVLIEDCSG
jgi:xanthine dehydrogenase accessory factor